MDGNHGLLVESELEEGEVEKVSARPPRSWSLKFVVAGFLTVFLAACTVGLALHGSKPEVIATSMATNLDTDDLARITISTRGNKQVFVRGDQEVVLMGANYVVKASPWFPPIDVVRRNAQQLANDTKKMTFQPPPDANGNTRIVVPFVRLGAMWGAYMPEKQGEIDEEFVKSLEATVEAFQEAGVYVVLDIHQDNGSPTNGGEGIPAWVPITMQQSDPDPAKNYITTPERPLRVANFASMDAYLQERHLPGVLQLASGVQAGEPVPIQSGQLYPTLPGDSNPWKAYSPGSDTGSPSRMNIGNPNMLLNNNDRWWHLMAFSEQAQNLMTRFILSASVPKTDDYKKFFLPYVQYVKYLAKVWKKFPNVLFVELMNEPAFTGLTNPLVAAGARKDLYHFYAQVMTELEKSLAPAQLPPVAIEDLGGLVGFGVGLFAPAEDVDLAKLNTWASQKKLVFSVHWYGGPLYAPDPVQQVHTAQQAATELGNPPVFLSEFYGTEEAIATTLAQVVTQGCNAVSWWHFVDSAFTKQDGWVIFPAGQIYDVSATPGNGPDPALFKMDAFNVWSELVANGTSFGAYINGAGTGHGSGLMALVAPLPPPSSA